MSEVEVNKVFGFYAALVGTQHRVFALTMRHETAKVPSHHAVPCCSFARIELLCVSFRRLGRVWSSREPLA